MADKYKPQRLSKVAREFNVGISTIVDFLSGKGVEIATNPNTKIEQEAYTLLVQEYDSDRGVKEQSKKVSIRRERRKTISIEESKEPAVAEEEAPAAEAPAKETPAPAPAPAPEPTPAPAPAPVAAEEEAKPETPEPTPAPEEKAPEVEKPVAEEKAEKVEEPAKEEPVAEAPAQETPAAATEEKEEEQKGPKVLGKIDLSSIPQRKKKKEEKAPAAKDATPKASQAEKKEDKPVAQKKEVEKAAPTKEEPAKAKPAAEAPAKKEEAPAKEEPAKASNEPETIKATVDKLSGPKVLGKIELPTPPKKKKPVASSSDNSVGSANKKKKRKRIRPGEKVDKKDTNNQSQSNNAGNNNNNNNRNKRGGRNNNRRQPANAPKAELTEEQVQKQIRETLARLSGGNNKSKSSKYRRQKRDAVSQKEQERLEQLQQESKVIKVTEFATANDLSTMMEVSINEIISACMSLGMMVSINQRLDADTLKIVAEEFGYEVEFVTADVQENIIVEEDKEEDLLPRSPIVTVMGHVDHGKTSLLDHVRKANVIAGEAGGITQHIGAYNVSLEDGRNITFLDTPGHEAFTAMRARGAQVTDIAIIMVAADDSVMPQTKEAINHAQAAGVPMVFAINKIDKPGANPDKIKEELAAMNILVEDWGGKFQSQEISAKKGLHVDELLEKVLLEAEMLDLKANPAKKAVGSVIESSLDKGRGYVSTILVQGGTLKTGDIIVAGCYSGRIKAMLNERGQRIDEAGPAMPVEILGLNGAPQAGDKFNVMNDDKEARDIAQKRLQLQKEQGRRTQKHITLDEISRRLAVGDFKELNVIVKGDVDGSIEALSDSLLKLSTEQIQVNIIHKSVGQISESDVLLASASDAIIIGFQVRPSASARKLAEKEEIEIRLYSIIYDAIEELKAAMEGMLAPKFEEQIVCNIEVRETFKISKVGTIAGCMVLDGKVNRNTNVRVIRDGIVIYSGQLGSLKRFKDDVKEVASGYECGLNIDKFNDIKVGDIIEGYEEVEIKQKL